MAKSAKPKRREKPRGKPRGQPREKPAVIERPLGGTEKIYWLLDKLYCLNFAAYAELEGELDAATLQAALAEIQDETPLLRARIVLDGKLPMFEPAAPEEHPLCLETCSLQGWRRQLEAQLDTRFATAAAPLVRCVWFRGRTAKSVIAMASKG